MKLSSAALDRTVQSLQTSFHPDTHSEVFDTQAKELRYIETTIDDMTSRDVEPMDQTLYYGLLARKALAVTNVVAPTLFTHENSVAIISDVVDGTAGLTSALLGQALDRYDSPKSGYIKDELAGAIGELTFLTQANLAEDGRQLAVPAPLKDDWFRQTDAYVYHRMSGTQLPHKAAIQVKSGWFGKKGLAPKNGFKVTGADMQNPRHDDFPISRALHSLHSTGRLTPQESTQLEAANAHLQLVLNSRLAGRPGTALTSISPKKS